MKEANMRVVNKYMKGVNMRINNISRQNFGGWYTPEDSAAKADLRKKLMECDSDTLAKLTDMRNGVKDVPHIDLGMDENLECEVFSTKNTPWPEHNHYISQGINDIPYTVDGNKIKIDRYTIIKNEDKGLYTTYNVLYDSEPVKDVTSGNSAHHYCMAVNYLNAIVSPLIRDHEERSKCVDDLLS